MLLPPPPTCHHAADCPFINYKHICTWDSAAAARRCLGFLPPKVPERLCTAQRWWPPALDAALGSSGTLYYVGDSIAAQQWRALLCVEHARVDPAHPSYGRLMQASRQNIPPPDRECLRQLGGGLGCLCVPLRPRTNSSNGSATPAQRICYTRTTDRGQFFEAAARILAAPRTSADDVVHLNSVYSHDGVSRSGARTSD